MPFAEFKPASLFQSIVCSRVAASQEIFPDVANHIDMAHPPIGSITMLESFASATARMESNEVICSAVI